MAIFNETGEIEKYLFGHINKDRKKLFSGQKGIHKVNSTLKELGNPEKKIQIIHIAGTSGKGSTAFFISKILVSLGFKVGLHVSPHLLDIRERFQINNRCINKRKFSQYFNEILPIIQKRDSSPERLSYFEILTIFSLHVFCREKVDYAVLETGLGGLYDATNAITDSRKTVVLTKIGLDHTEILGRTIKKIAYQKAMIIQSRSIVVSCRQSCSAQKVIRDIVNKKKAELFVLTENLHFSNIYSTLEGVTFDFKFYHLVLPCLKLAMIGRHQAENCALALATVWLLSRRNHFKLNKSKIRKVLKKSIFPARLEIKKIGGKNIIIDGAHNPQKMAMLLENLKEIFPNTKFDFLIGFKKNKNISKMLSQIMPFAWTVTATGFFLQNSNMPDFSEDPKEIISFLKKIGFHKCQAMMSSKEALKSVVKTSESLMVVTGSLYLISEIYESIV